MESHGAPADLSVLCASTDMTFSVLILAGTSEGRLLARRLASDARYRTLLSYAGRTESLHTPDSAFRVGGFGGALGLATFLREQAFDALVDTTHPFAARMSANAVEAAKLTGTPLIRLTRPRWQALPTDLWTEVPTMQAAADALGQAPRRVFLTVGRQEIAAFRRAPQHDYLVRAVDPFDTGLPHARVIAARGPFTLESERQLLIEQRIELLVSKNSGTELTYAKLQAARELGVPVVMVQRPEVPPARECASLADVISWLATLHGASPRSGLAADDPPAST
jgi:precorrin-6A/cobalt-precorrin-6A reductase